MKRPPTLRNPHCHFRHLLMVSACLLAASSGCAAPDEDYADVESEPLAEASAALHSTAPRCAAALSRAPYSVEDVVNDASGNADGLLRVRSQQGFAGNTESKATLLKDVSVETGGLPTFVANYETTVMTSSVIAAPFVGGGDAGINIELMVSDQQGELCRTDPIHLTYARAFGGSPGASHINNGGPGAISCTARRPASGSIAHVRVRLRSFVVIGLGSGEAAGSLTVGDLVTENCPPAADVILTGGAGWATMPVATALGEGEWTVSNNSVGDFGAWSASGNVEQIAGDFAGDGHTDVALTGPSSWHTIPVARGIGGGQWQVVNTELSNPSFALWSSLDSVRHLAGDFDGDGKMDIALTGQPGWSTIPIAFSRGDSPWQVTLGSAADFAVWSSLAGVRKVVGDFDADGKADIALTGGAGWGSIPVASADGVGGFRVTNEAAPNFPGWATTSGVQVLSGDFNGDGRTDLALSGPASWHTVPVALSRGNGGWTIQNGDVGDFGAWSSLPNVSRLVGDFDGDGRSDIALTGATGWSTVPVAFSNGDGTWRVLNGGVGDFAVWSTAPGVTRLTGDFNRDGRTDIALTRGAGWGTIPVALSRGDGNFDVKNGGVGEFGSWATVSGAVSFVGHER